MILGGGTIVILGTGMMVIVGFGYRVGTGVYGLTVIVGGGTIVILGDGMMVIVGLGYGVGIGLNVCIGGGKVTPVPFTGFEGDGITSFSQFIIRFIILSIQPFPADGGFGLLVVPEVISCSGSGFENGVVDAIPGVSVPNCILQ